MRERDEREQAEVGHQASRLRKQISFSGKVRTLGKKIKRNEISVFIKCVVLECCLSEKFRYDGNASK